MKKKEITGFSIEDYMVPLIFFGAACSVLVLGLMVKMAYFIDVSEMYVA